MNVKSRILNILFWSVVSAAFIGPGTITTAPMSGALFGTQLLWALLFSTLACLLLQEASSRGTIASGKNLGQALTQRRNEGAFGMAGGLSGLPGNQKIIRKNGDIYPFQAIENINLEAGDQFIIETPGGGGYGVE